MSQYTRIIREYSDIGFRYTKGKIDIFLDKEFHPYYELYLLVNGNIEFFSDHSRQKLSPYHLVIIPPGEYHRFCVMDDQASEYERYVLTIHPDFLSSTVLAEALHGKELLALKPESRIAGHILYLHDAMLQHSEENFRYILSGIAADLIFLIKQSPNIPQDIPQKGLHPLAAEIMNYINRYYKTGLTLHAIAEHFFLSVSTVSHLFKNNFGVSIKQYITAKQMNEISTCLKQGKKPQEVCHEFGFSNYSTFYRSYCRHFGVSPSGTSAKTKQPIQEKGRAIK